VSVRRDGRRRLYQARREQLGPLAEVLKSLWRDRLEERKALAEAEELGADPLADHRHGPADDRRGPGRGAQEAWHGLVRFRWVTGFWDPPAPSAEAPAESSGRLEQA
jgi:hypothetical protein